MSGSRITIPKETQLAIKRRIEQVRAGGSVTERAFAEEGALHLNTCLWESVGLRPDGTWVIKGEHDTNTIANRDQIIVLASAVPSYPELAALLPKRTVSAIDCDACKGDGRHSKHRLIACDVCFGLGWHDDHITNLG